MNFILQIFVTFVAALSLLLTGLALFRLRQPTTLALWAMKVFTSALSPFLFLVGLLAALAGLACQWAPAIALGGFSALVWLIHIIVITRSALGQQKKGESGGMPRWVQKSMGEDYHRLGFNKDTEPGILSPMLGGNPDEKPEAYSMFSPLTHVHKGCPPTLILHGKHDILAPPEAIRQLQARLEAAGVPVVMHLIPQTDHAFDLILPKISPPAHNAFYNVERFMALMV